MPIPTLPSISAETITTERLSTRVLFSGRDDSVPVLFLHGNLSSATWWEEVMLTLPHDYHGITPDQRGFGDAEPTAKIDATRGAGDWADDAIALLDYLNIERIHVVGNSLGGSVVWRLLMDIPERILTATQVAPGSPYGFGGTKDRTGTPCWLDYAGSGGGLSNPDLIRSIQDNDRSLDSPFCLRAALRALVYKPPYVPEREEDILSSSLSVHIGPQDTPGDFMPSQNWPNIAPGEWGAANALSPKYADDPARLLAIEPKPAILWIRGSHDLAISDMAASDPGTLGAAGVLPDWPGAEQYPPQPMLAQTRAVLEAYKCSGGWYNEVIIEDAAHAPYLEKPNEFNEELHNHLGRT